MADLAWRPEFEVGHDLMDGDHRTLVEALDHLRALPEAPGDTEAVAVALTFLRDYTVSHFGAEEELMIRARYPRAAGHFAAHADLLLRVSDLMADHRLGRIVSVAALAGFLEGWLMQHILGPDRDLGAYLKRPGV